MYIFFDKINNQLSKFVTCTPLINMFGSNSTTKQMLFIN